MKVQTGHVSSFGVAQFARRQFCGCLIGLMMLAAATTTAWSAGVSDIIWLESNSTVGNSILAFQNNGTATPNSWAHACNKLVVPLSKGSRPALPRASGH